MDFEIYRKNFYSEAMKYSLDQDYINRCMKYAHNLYKRKLPIIYDQTHLSLLLGFEISFLRDVSDTSEMHYKSYLIPKKTGGSRRIFEPHPRLLYIQRWINTEILSKAPTSPYAKAYKKNKTIVDSAKYHINKRQVIRLDIKEFFPSIKFGKVFKVFMDFGYSRPVALLLAKLCLRKDRLTQGSATSPTLSNLVFLKLDEDISNFCVQHAINYTRYADDMIFSSNDLSYKELIDFVEVKLKENDFLLNKKKTKRMKQSRKQVVNGLVVNQKLNIDRRYKHKIRQEMYYIQKYGLLSHLENAGITKIAYAEHLMGKINFSLSIRPDDEDLLEYKKNLQAEIFQ